MKRAALISGVCLLLVTTGISCTSSDALKKAQADITDNDLAIMVLPAEEMGDDYEGLEVFGDGSGQITNVEAAEDSFDTDRTAEDLEEMGRVTGYDLTYRDPGFLSRDGSGGLLTAVTSVTLFEDAEGASAFIDKEESDAEEAKGEVQEGVLLEDFETGPADLADEAMVMEFHAVFGELDIYGTVVYLRLDRLVGLAAVKRGDDQDVIGEVERIVGLLDERIRGVLLGSVSATPVPLPDEGDDEDLSGDDDRLDATPPVDSPDLSAMALGPGDFPEGVTVSREGYAPDAGEAVAKFSREFDPSSAVGEAPPFARLKNDIEVYADAANASVQLRSLQAISSGEAGEDFVASLIEEGAGAGIELSDVSVTPIAVFGGDWAVGYQASFDSALGRFDAALVLVQVDRIVGMISLVGMDLDGDGFDVTGLASTLAQRISGGLNAPQ
ncbi:MAG: hypothetical protein WEE64_13310 [Dehalococcoidia bacterium]